MEQAHSELESTQLELEDAKRTLRLEKTSLIEQESQVAAIEVLRNKLSKEKEKVWVSQPYLIHQVQYKY